MESFSKQMLLFGFYAWLDVDYGVGVALKKKQAPNISFSFSAEKQYDEKVWKTKVTDVSSHICTSSVFLCVCV